MASSSSPPFGPPIFSRENYHIWPIKMKSYLKSLNLWDVVEQGGADVPALRANATLNEIKKHDELITREPRALTCLHSAVSEVIFTRIMACDTARDAWNKLKEEFEESERVKAVRLLTLKREFEMLKIKDSEGVKDYSTKLMDIVNQIQLYGENFTDQKIVKKDNDKPSNKI